MPSCEGFSPGGRTPNRVRERRRELALTCAEVARLSGISEVTLWRVETGRVRPLRSTALLLAIALRMDAADLLLDTRDGR